LLWLSLSLWLWGYLQEMNRKEFQQTRKNSGMAKQKKERLPSKIEAAP